MCERLGPETKAIIAAIEGLKPAHENLNYQILTIDLTAARLDVQFDLPGWFNHIAVGRLTGTAGIRLNEATKDLIDLTYVKTLSTPISRFYLTNVAQPGSVLILAIGGIATFAAYPSTRIVTPTIVLNGQVVVAAPRVPLAAAATPIQGITIENLLTNDVVYVGNAAVAAANGYRLQPGATVSMDVDDLNKVNVAGTAGNIVSFIAVN